MSFVKKSIRWPFALRVVALIFLLSSLSLAQMGMMRGPSPLAGMFHPKVGVGAAYQVADSKGETSEMEMAIVGKEEVGGVAAYWMEIPFAGRRNGQMVMKYLMAPKGDAMQVYRVIMKSPEMGAMEMPEMMLSRLNQSLGQNFSATEKGMGKNLGTEVIMTKLGSKKCTHWQKESSGGTSDVWVSEDIYPTSLVKSVTQMNGGTQTMELIKEITGARTKITEEPRKMNMPGMPPGK